MLRIPVIALFVLICGYTTARAQVTIQGNIKPHPEWRNMVYLLYMPDSEGVMAGYDGFVIDSAQISPDGNFSFVNQPYAPGIYRLNTQRNETLGMGMLMVGSPEDNFIHLVVSQPTEIIHVESEVHTLYWFYRLSQASEANALIRRGVDALEPLHQAIVSMYSEIKEVQQNGDTAQLERSVAKWRSIALTNFGVGAKQIRPLIAEAQNVHAAIVLINYHNQVQSPLAYEAFFNEQLTRLEKLDPNNVFLAKMRSDMVAERTILPVGAIAPDIALPNAKDEVTRLSEVGKRLVIIDFWASWCAPCIQESKNVIQPLYKAWKDKGLEVYAVSIDKDKKAWQGAINKHGYGSWINVVDYTTGNVVKPLYDFSAVPTIYLIDENMNIVAKNLRGSMLTDFVEQYLGR